MISWPGLLNKNYRSLILGTFLTGASGLIFQLVWQRYLSIFVGAEARSAVIVVSLFLFGLAIGNYYWGFKTKKFNSRNELLNCYGLIELGIGFWGLFFPLLFQFVFWINGFLPNSLIIQFFLSCFLILPPTFLMGSTIPVLTGVLPEKEEQVNDVHSKIYGINTLGAFLGILIGGFFLIETLGLQDVNLLCGLVNITVGIIFLSQELDGEVKKPAKIPKVFSKFPQISFFILTFISGAVSISLEIMLIRTWGLAIGPSVIVFPIVLAIVVLGLGLGSLTLKDPSEKSVQIHLLWAFILLSVVYFTIPFHPYWVSSLRVSMLTIPKNYFNFYFLSSLGLAVLTLPIFFVLGRLLPIGFSFLDKSGEDYGFKCGILYAINTAGTFFGSTFLSYLALKYIDFDRVFSVNILLVGLVLMYFSLARGKKWIWISAIILITPISFFFPWNRADHMEAMFRQHKRYVRHDLPFYKLPKHQDKGFRNLFYKDGVNASVSVNNYHLTGGLSIINNGKSDSNTVGDRSTLTLSAAIPYFYAQENDIEAAIVGLGTGVTSGFLSIMDDVKEVNVIEISPSVVEVMPLFDEESFHASKNPKLNVHTMDAFRYFHKIEDRFHIVISEPTNPWTIGVENLFTPEFYQMVKRSLKEDGIFLQWFHIYSMSEEVFGTVVKNVLDAFPYNRMFVLGTTGDIGFISSAQPLRKSPNFKKRISEEILAEEFRNLHMPPQFFESLILYNRSELLFGLNNWGYFKHSLYKPKISYEALKAFYMKRSVDYDELVPRNIRASIKRDEEEEIKLGVLQEIIEWKKSNPENAEYCSYETRRLFSGKNPFCERMDPIVTQYENLINSSAPYDRLYAYSTLRRDGFIPMSIPYIEGALEMFYKMGNMSQEYNGTFLTKLASIVCEEGFYELAHSFIKEFKEKDLISSKDETLFHQIVQNQKELSEKLGL